MPRLSLLAATSATFLAALPLLARTVDHSAHMIDGTESAATLAFIAANAEMHQGMAIAFTGNTDVDFITGMIPHHQGAVEMARILLEHGTAPEVRAFAQAVIDAQQAEITWMQDWLATHGG